MYSAIGIIVFLGIFVLYFYKRTVPQGEVWITSRVLFNFTFGCFETERQLFEEGEKVQPFRFRRVFKFKTDDLRRTYRAVIDGVKLNLQVQLSLTDPYTVCKYESMEIIAEGYLSHFRNELWNAYAVANSDVGAMIYFTRKREELCEKIIADLREASQNHGVQVVSLDYDIIS
jgi:hypothetical protein